MDWEAIKEVLKWLEPYGFIFVIAICAYTFVLTVGRALQLVQSFRIKNIIAFIYIIAGMFFYFYFRQDYSFKEIDIYLNIVIFSSFSMLFYMIVLWRLLDRADGFMDKWFSKDKGFSIPKKKKALKKSPPK